MVDNEPMEEKLTDEQAQKVQEEIKQIKQTLNKLNAEKEDFFTKKEETSKKIRALIAEVVESKKERNKLTDSVKDTKELRTKLNQEITSRIKTIGGRPARGPRKKGESPDRIKKKIEELSLKIETEAMSFDKERSTNKQIKELKKKLAQMEPAPSVGGAEVPKDLKELKKKADEEHKKIQKVAKESQEMHLKILEKSKVIDQLKEEEKKWMNKFLEKKEEFTNVNNELKAKLKLIEPYRKEMGLAIAERKENEKKKTQKRLEERKKDAEEKLKKGKKLTTEDLLAMQSGN